jgi:hypothetical protein
VAEHFARLIGFLPRIVALSSRDDRSFLTIRKTPFLTENHLRG